MPSPHRPKRAPLLRAATHAAGHGNKPRRPTPDRTAPALPECTLLFATTSGHKLAELVALAAPSGCSIVSALGWRDQSGAPLAAVREDGDSFVDNAAIKALAAHRATGLNAVADDSGLCVDALDGAPGVFSARYAGEPRDDDRNIDALLLALRDVEDPHRGAEFACALVLAGPLAEGPMALHSHDGIAYRAVVGRSRGRILVERHGDGGFGYDSIFFSDALGCSFGEASAEEKASCSHRGAAFAELLPTLTALREFATRQPAPLFVRPAGIGALTAALAETFDNDLRYAVRGLENAIAERPMLGGKERVAVGSLLFSALRRLAGLQLASMALRGQPLATPDPRQLAPRDAAMIAALALADVDEFGQPLPHRSPGERSALAAMVARHANLEAQLPAPAIKLEKALRAARHGLSSLPQALALEAGVHPDFYNAMMAQLGPEHAAAALAFVSHQGPPTLRIANADQRQSVITAVERLGARTVAVADLPAARVLLGTARVTGLPAYADGQFEVQDAGSQRIVAMVGVVPGMRIADWCAGAGGKTLALASAMRAEAGKSGAKPGRIVALDVNNGRLDEARRRIARAGVGDLCDVRQHAYNAAGDDELGVFDAVLVDAPCSSSGALRRTPELRWHLDDRWLDSLPPEQLAIALRAAARVRPGGRLIYATCSLLPAENEAVVAKIVETLGWQLIAESRFGPANAAFLARGPVAAISCDGFYSAVIERPHA
mgnify:CR=1 FL=1|jgi:16S rRNA (cytosine967-C5)-methyltransferase